MFRTLFFAFIFLPLITSCINKPEMSVLDMPPVASVLDTPSVVPTDFNPDKYMFVKELNAKGKPVFFYQDHEGYMHYYNGKEDMIINREVMDKYKKMGAVPLSMSYAYDGKYVYFSQPVRWGPKKLIFIKLEPEGKVVYTKELSSLEQVITTASVAFDVKGGMLLTWTDETSPYLKAAYMLVKGDSFPEKEEVISYEDAAVISARPAFTDKGLAVVYVTVKTSKEESVTTKSGEIKVRFLSDGSEKVLFSGNVFDFDLTEGKGGFLLRPYQLSLDIKLIAFNASFDRIKEYTIDKPKEIGEGFSLFTNEGLIEGEPFVLGTGSSPGSVEIEGRSLPQRPNLYYSYAGKGFERVAGGRPFMFSSTVNSFDSSGKKTVLAYMDRRFASPTVMVAVIDSAGKLIKRDVVIEKPGLDTGTPSVVSLGGDIFRVFYPVKDRGKEVWTYRAKDINADSIDSLYSLPSAQDRKELLIESANRYAYCRKKNDYSCVYDLFDPTYRAITSKGAHEDMMKRIDATILDFRFDNCRILEDSVLGACDGYMKAELPKEIKGTQPYPIKEKQRIVEKQTKGDLWVFIDGNWYYLVDLPMMGYAQQW